MQADAIWCCHPPERQLTIHSIKTQIGMWFNLLLPHQSPNFNILLLRARSDTDNCTTFFCSKLALTILQLLLRRNVFMSNLKQFVGSLHESLGSYGMNNFTAVCPPREKPCLRQTKHAASIWPIQQSHSAYLTSLNSHVQLFPFFLLAPVTNVEAIEGQQAHLYCPMTTQNADKINMVLWFKDDVGVPIYR